MVIVIWMVWCTNVLWAVNANWNADNGGWNVEANSVTNPNRWNADNQVVSRNSIFFRLGLPWRFFCKQTPFPPTYHAPDFFDILPECDKM